MRWLALLAVVGCGGDGDPCGATAGTCATIRVTSTGIARVDSLELDVSYGDGHGTAITMLAAPAALPVETGVALDVTLPVGLGVVVAGRLDGQVLGTGFAATELAGGATLVVAIEPPAMVCVATGTYCGGDKVAGDPETLYRCGAQGMAYARGACASGCQIGTNRDDTCYGGGPRCTTGTRYCGGDKVDGDPRTLYTCQADGTGVTSEACVNRCEVVAGHPDTCR